MIPAVNMESFVEQISHKRKMKLKARRCYSNNYNSSSNTFDLNKYILWYYTTVIKIKNQSK